MLCWRQNLLIIQAVGFRGAGRSGLLPLDRASRAVSPLPGHYGELHESPAGSSFTFTVKP